MGSGCTMQDERCRIGVHDARQSMQGAHSRVWGAGSGTAAEAFEVLYAGFRVQGVGHRTKHAGGIAGVQALGQGVPAPLHSFPAALLQHPLPMGTAAKSIRRGCCCTSPVCLKGLQPSRQLAPLTPCHLVPLGAGRAPRHHPCPGQRGRVRLSRDVHVHGTASHKKPNRWDLQLIPAT